MSNALKRSLILIVASVYLVFACSYVIFCIRNTSVINLPDSFRPPVSKHNAALAIKSVSNSENHLIHNFLNRPRVIANRLLVFSFFLWALALLPYLISFRAECISTLKGVIPFHYPLGAIRCRNLRIWSLMWHFSLTFFTKTLNIGNVLKAVTTIL